MSKIIGGIVGIIGIAVMMYFKLVSSTAPNPWYPLMGALIVAIGFGIIIVNRLKAKPGKNGQA